MSRSLRGLSRLARTWGSDCSLTQSRGREAAGGGLVVGAAGRLDGLAQAVDPGEPHQAGDLARDDGGGAAQHVAITGSVVLKSTAPPVFRLEDAVATCERSGYVLATLPLGDPGFALSDNRFTAATPFAWMRTSLPSPVRCGQYSAMGSAGDMLMYHTSDVCSVGSWGAICTTLNGN